MIRVRSVHPAPEPARPASATAAAPVTRQIEWPQVSREFEIDHGERTFTLRIAPAEAASETTFAASSGIALAMPRPHNGSLRLVISA